MYDSAGTNEILLDIKKTLNNLYEDVKAFYEDKKASKPINTEANFANKKNSYIEKLNEGSIKEPKQPTLEYYKVEKERDKYVYVLYR